MHLLAEFDLISLFRKLDSTADTIWEAQTDGRISSQGYHGIVLYDSIREHFIFSFIDLSFYVESVCVRVCMCACACV